VEPGRGHDVQVVARLRGGPEVVALQRRARDDGVGALAPGERLWLDWSTAPALLLGPADAGPTSAARPAEPLEAHT